jgi:hypothetical protein
MSEHPGSTKSTPEQGQPTQPSARQRSSIAFPYNSFGDVEKLVAAIHNNVGTGSCSMGQLAVWTQQSPKSSGFRMQVAAARLFEVVEGDGENLRLTALGKQISDPLTVRKAKAEAFLNVPLFAALYQSHKDALLPPPAALEREIAELGVSVKQKDRARQVFERSAEETGFFEFGKGRLVMPAVKGDQVGKGNEGNDGSGGTGGGSGSGNGGDLDLDPLLMALLRKIPKADAGWPKEQRIRWFKTFAMNVSQVYDDANEPVELSISETAN